MKKWLRNIGNKIKYGLQRFMYGRYGVDELSNFLLRSSFLFIIPCIFIRSSISIIFYCIFWALIIYTYFRMLSKNIYKRQVENTWFVNKKNYLKQRFTQRKQYKFFDCPKCKAHLRVPRGAGMITITCKKCGHQFDRKA